MRMSLYYEFLDLRYGNIRTDSKEHRNGNMDLSLTWWDRSASISIIKFPVACFIPCTYAVPRPNLAERGRKTYNGVIMMSYVVTMQCILFFLLHKFSVVVLQHLVFHQDYCHQWQWSRSYSHCRMEEIVGVV